MRPRTLIAVVVAAGLLAFGGNLIAQAAIPSATKVFTACVNKTSGAVRLIDAEATPPVQCKSSEFRTTWNQAGQPGPPGVLSPDDLYTASNNAGNEVLSGFFATSLCDVGDTVLGAIVVHVSGSDRWDLEQVEETGTGAVGMSVLVYDQGTPHGGLVRAQCLDTAAPSH